MAFVGNAQFTSYLVEVWEDPQSWAVYIEGGGNRWVYAAQRSGMSSIAVEALVSQGYTLAGSGSGIYTLQRGPSEVPENPGVTAIWPMTQVLKDGEKVKSGPCFVATACYGNYDHPDVIVFRRWRDDVLLSSLLGRIIVSAYYKLSPGIASRIQQERRLSAAIRAFVLEPFARRLGR